MLVLAACYILIFVLLLVRRTELFSRYQYYCIFFIFIIALCILGSMFNSNVGLDIERHYEFLDLIRENGATFKQLVMGAYGGYKGLVTFNLIRLLVCKISYNNHLLPFIMTFISYSSISYILLDNYFEYRIKYSDLLKSLLITFTLTPYYFVVCGVRNGAAACLMALAIYIYLCKGNSILSFLVISFLAITIHPATLLAVPFVVISRLDFNVKTSIAVLVISLISNLFAKLLLLTGNSLLVSLGNSYLLYSSDDQFRSAYYFLFADLILIISYLIFVVFNLYSKNKIEFNSKLKRGLNFITYYSIFIIGNIGNYDLILRPSYVLGPLAPLALYFIKDRIKSFEDKRMQWLYSVCIYIVCILTICRYMLFFMKSTYLA